MMRGFRSRTLLLSALGLASACAESSSRAPETIDGRAGDTGVSGHGGDGGRTQAAGGTGNSGHGGSTAGGSLGTSGHSGETNGSSGAGGEDTSGAGGAGVETGGSTGTGGSSGTGDAGGAGSAGGAGGGTGGSPGTGGFSGTGGAGAVGAAGTRTSAGEGGSGGDPAQCPSPAEVAVMQESRDPLDGRLITMTCDTPQDDECSLIALYYGGNGGQRTNCVGGRMDFIHDYDVGGEEGAAMQVTLHFYGIMEPKNYGAEVEREAGDQPADRNGGTPLPWAEAPGSSTYPSSLYNAYEIHVYDENDQQVRQYFLNSDTQEGHYTFVIDYEKTIGVIGGGRVRVRFADDNCRQMKNCGATSGYPCADKARIIDISGADPQPPSGALVQPGLSQNDPNHSGQWFLIDVTNVTCE